MDLLWFPELRIRAGSITKAHEGTYRWLLQEPELIAESSATDSTTKPLWQEEVERESWHRETWRKEFVNWLETGSGPFYITGKPGSGKSTLVKSIVQDPLTRQLLQTWGTLNGKDLLLGSFFFWSSGTPLQRSTNGLYRSMLWEVLRLNPGLIREILPDLYRKAAGGALHESDLDPDDLEAAFGNLIGHEKVLGKHRVCFFIDGLDEFDGDYWALAKHLNSWCCGPDVKICVSSRPHNEFLAVFGEPGPWLALHELTRGTSCASFKTSSPAMSGWLRLEGPDMGTKSSHRPSSTRLKEYLCGWF